ncbi:NAD(P)/FAD-dependent oxidoreductase [Anaerorhabdus sp.]|uniref:NAD(P)/FAD-dependent oxidoreductase n=1 Tax=Anaerorhabdus sp. TaxID=1872524 RepID=UPI002FC9FE0B
MKRYRCVVIGGGSAGLASALSLYNEGIHEILILERDQELGGILNQCIHNGFGLHTFKEELSGPAYAERYIDLIHKTTIEIKCNTMVTSVSEDKIIEYVNPVEGYVQIVADAIIEAMGCRERTRGAISIPGYRPSGIWTAGTAQRYLNMEGYLCGKRVFILGSGDIGLIMARRMTLEGAIVCGVAEIMPYSNGLPRNIKQCLEDFNIPLYLSHTITDIKGLNRVEGITISEVDSNFKPIDGSEKSFDVDTVLLSVGLVPENALSEEAHIQLHPKTKGPIVNESYMTSVEGIFACGNVLHVHDLVDFVSHESGKTGLAVAKYLNHQLILENGKKCLSGNGIGYVVPMSMQNKNITDNFELLFRVTKPSQDGIIRIKDGDRIIKEIKKKHLNPSEMEKVILSKEECEKVKQEILVEVIQ